MLLSCSSRCARSAARLPPGARQAVQPHARSAFFSPAPLGARAAPHASRRARAKQFSRMPGNSSRSADVGTIRSRSTKEMETYKG